LAQLLRRLEGSARAAVEVRQAGLVPEGAAQPMEEADAVEQGAFRDDSQPPEPMPIAVGHALVGVMWCSLCLSLSWL